MDAKLMSAALAQLEQALFNHDQWSEAINQTLICRLPFDERDVDPEAHKHCRFGQWYYGPGAKSLQDHPGFAEIAVEHKRMHELAAELLRRSTHCGAPSLEDYERFMAATKRMRLEAQTMKHELADALRNIDPLTGAENRTSMLPKLREEHELVKRDVHSCALAMLDIDKFKAVNDDYGHVSGDKVLGTFAALALSDLRSNDRLFRYGGEEFLICAPGADIEKGTALLERLLADFAAQIFEFPNMPPFHVTVSAGLTMLDPAISVEETINRADRALYAAKAAGRNRVMVWNPGMT